MLRLATPDDYAQLIALEHTSFTSDMLSARQMRYLLTRAHATTFVYEENSRIVGYIMLLERKGWKGVRIYSLATDGAYRGKGVATALLQRAEKYAQVAKKELISLEVKKNNIEAQALYKKHGYIQYGTVPRYYEDGADALKLRKVC